MTPLLRVHPSFFLSFLAYRTLYIILYNIIEQESRAEHIYKITDWKSRGVLYE